MVLVHERALQQQYGCEDISSLSLPATLARFWRHAIYILGNLWVCFGKLWREYFVLEATRRWGVYTSVVGRVRKAAVRAVWLGICASKGSYSSSWRRTANVMLMYLMCAVVILPPLAPHYQSTLIRSSLSPKRDWGPKRVIKPFFPPQLHQYTQSPSWFFVMMLLTPLLLLVRQRTKMCTCCIYGGP